MHGPIAANVPRDLIEWLLVVFTVLGVVIAIYQSFNSASVSRAARDAIEATERHLAANQLIGMMASLQQLESELTELTKDDERPRVLSNLLRWRQQGSEILGILERRDDADHELVASFKKLVFESNQAHQQLGDGRTTIKQQTKKVKEAVADALSQLARYSGALKSTSSGGSHK